MYLNKNFLLGTDALLEALMHQHRALSSAKPAPVEEEPKHSMEDALLAAPVTTRQVVNRETFALALAKVPTRVSGRVVSRKVRRLAARTLRMKVS